jgi:hypothetical protein
MAAAALDSTVATPDLRSFFGPSSRLASSDIAVVPTVPVSVASKLKLPAV